MGKVRFFQKTFLVADTRREMVWSRECLSLPPAVQTYGLHLEDLHGYRSLVDDQAGRTLQCEGIGGGPRGTMIKALVARSGRPRVSPSRSPLSIRIIPIFSHQTPRRRYPKYTGINDYPIDLAFRITRWRSKHCLSARKMVAFDCVSEADYQKTGTCCL